jgi:hypothetical protein
LEAHWIDDQLEGRAVLHWADGHLFEGEFKKNELHGKGILTLSDGTKMEGNFSNTNAVFTYVKRVNISILLSSVKRFLNQ